MNVDSTVTGQNKRNAEIRNSLGVARWGKGPSLPTPRGKVGVGLHGTENPGSSSASHAYIHRHSRVDCLERSAGRPKVMKLSRPGHAFS